MLTEAGARKLSTRAQRDICEEEEKRVKKGFQVKKAGKFNGTI